MSTFTIATYMIVFGYSFFAGTYRVYSSAASTSPTTTATSVTTTSSTDLLSSPMFIGLTVGFGSFAAFSLVCCVMFKYGGCFRDRQVGPLMSDDKVESINIKPE